MKDKYVTALVIARNELEDATKWSDVDRAVDMLNKILDEVL